MSREPNSTAVPSRRSFLKGGAAAAVALAGGGLLANAPQLFAADAGGDGYGGLKMGLQSYTLRKRSFENMLSAMHADLKLHFVELFPAHLAAQSPASVAEKLKAADVAALSYGVVGFTKDEAANRKLFELAKSYGFTNLSCDPDPDSFDGLDKLTEEYKITVAIHPHGPQNRWGKIDTIQKAIKDHSKMIGLCADTGHLIRAGEDPMRAVETFKDRLYAIHLKDFKKVGDGKWEDVPATEGSLDVNALVKFLLANKYAGGVFIEYEGERKDDPNHPVTASLKSLETVKEAVKKAMA